MGLTAVDNLKPWGEYNRSDYTVQQWHDAALIHNHNGDPVSKAQCKLPIKTPSGMVHPGGVQAAAAAIGGARGGLKGVSDSQKASAKQTLLDHYKKMKQDPPESLTHEDLVGDFLEHFGVKGMHWGVRNPRGSSGVSKAGGEGGDHAKSEQAKALVKTFAKSEVNRTKKKVQILRTMPRGQARDREMYKTAYRPNDIFPKRQAKFDARTQKSFDKYDARKAARASKKEDRASAKASAKEKVTQSSKPPAHTLSDAELKNHVARMELEKRYSDLASGKHSKSKGAGAAFAKDLGKNSVKIAAAAVTTHAVNKALKASVK